MLSTATFTAKAKAYWERASCDTWHATAPKFSRGYFDQIEDWRYTASPCIHSFAQFSRYHGKKVLEVGFGAGTDFIQWLRSGALASGVDLTQEGLNNTKARIRCYDLPQPENLFVADAQALPFKDNSFDLGYSWGVLHITAAPEQAISELVRVVRPGGEIKIMVYNLCSICTLAHWVKYALLTGKPWKSFRDVLWYHLESQGTRAYTRREVRTMLAPLPITNLKIKTEATPYDYIPFNWLGFWHCISATKLNPA